nr:NAC domain-containing protein [Tanacetum cinerariifolium]
YNYEEVCELDYADSLNPGYHFSATDSEIIIYYLQRKIESGEQHPECRYYIADFYGDTPDNLAGKGSIDEVVVRGEPDLSHLTHGPKDGDEDLYVFKTINPHKQ